MKSFNSTLLFLCVLIIAGCNNKSICTGNRYFTS